MGAALYLMLTVIGTSLRATESTLRIRRLSGFVRVVELSDVRRVSTRLSMTPGSGFVYYSQLVVKLRGGRSVRLFATSGAKPARVSNLLDVLAQYDSIEVDVDVADFPRRASGRRS